MNIIFKIIFYFKKPPLVVVLAKPNSIIPNLLSISMKGWVDSPHLRGFSSILKNKVLLLNISDGKIALSDISFLIKRSSVSVLILNGRMADRELLKRFSERGLIIVDNETAKLFKGDEFKKSSVGFDDRSNLWASDLNIGEETNFKVNYGGDSVPFWIDRKLEKGQIIEILLTVRAGIAFGLNLVQISQNLKI